MLLLLVQTWLVDGLVPSVEVDSPSMAPSLPGRHAAMECPHCGGRFLCDADSVPAGLAACPNCGRAARRVPSTGVRPGARILVDRSALVLRAPKRWEPVVFRHPVTGEWTVKRVVGLPGESIQILGGEVWADGRLIAKPLPVLRATSTLVADTEPRGFPFSALRFPLMSPTPLPAGVMAESYQWLTFQAGGDDPLSTASPPPITDAGGYNGAVPRRAESVAAVGDLLLEIDLPAGHQTGSVVVLARRRSEDYALCGDLADHRWGVFLSGKPIPLIRPHGDGGNPRRLSVALADGRYLVAMDGEVFLEQAFREGTAPYNVEWTVPFAVGVNGIGLSAIRVRVFRDVYYAKPAGLGPNRASGEPIRLGRSEYFVLGDNSPVSEDSRNWEASPGVNHRALIGRAMTWELGSLP